MSCRRALRAARLVKQSIRGADVINRPARAEDRSEGLFERVRAPCVSARMVELAVRRNVGSYGPPAGAPEVGEDGA
jgi:hypothetical protein